MSIVVENITKEYGSQKAVNNISFTINSGEIVGFIGPNGAGKSTTMKILTGVIGDFKGNVKIDGFDIRKDINNAKKIVGYLPENNPLYLEMYVREYLGFIAGVYSVKGKKQKVEEIIELTGLTKESNKKISALSKGYRQRVGLASALIHDPKILILDEPTTGLDPNQIIEIRNLIASVGKEKTIMLSTHIMQEVEAICDKVIIIKNGDIVANEKASTIKDTNDSDKVTVIVEFGGVAEAKALIAIESVSEAKNIEGNTWAVVSQKGKDPRQDIFNFAVKTNNSVLSMQIEKRTLEDVFRDFTK